VKHVMFSLYRWVRCCIVHVKFEALRVMLQYILVFWNVVLCQLVYCYHFPADIMQNPRRHESAVLYMFHIKL